MKLIVALQEQYKYCQDILGYYCGVHAKRKHTPTRYGFLRVRAFPINTTTMAPRMSYRLSYLENFHFSNLLAASEAGC